MGFITLHLVDEILDVDLHGRTPVRDRGMGCRQYTSSSHATTLESNKSVGPSAIDQYIGDFAKDGHRDLSVVWRPVTPGATACTVAEGRAPTPSHHA